MRFWTFTGHISFLRDPILAFHHQRHAETILMQQTFSLDPPLLPCSCRGNSERISEAVPPKNRFFELGALRNAHFSSEAGKMQIWGPGEAESVIGSVIDCY